MAIIRGYGSLEDDNQLIYRWPNLANGDTGVAVSPKYYADLCVQVTGTFGSGGKMDLEGSNDGGSSWFVLKDKQGTTLALQDTSINALQEYPALIRPNVNAGDGTTDLSIHLVGRKPV